MTDLADLVEAFKREVAIPGTFTADFPLTTDDDLEAALGDAFAMAQLDGFFPRVVLDVDVMSVSPDISNAGAALVVLYAGTRMIRQKLRNLGVNRRYKAGPTEYETSVAVGLLVQELKDLQLRLTKLIDQAGGAGRATQVFVIDSYIGRQAGYGYGGFAAYELPTGVPALGGGTTGGFGTRVG